MYTLDELREKVLQRFEVDDILMLLDINAEELVDRFEDKFIDRMDDIQKEMEDLES
tara:strand:- start:137 stop:304 length:168 start_codon:yes stop_codon:yes gene_type:complete